MSDFLSENLLSIRKKFPGILPLLEKDYPSSLTLTRSRSDMPVPQQERGGRAFPMHSLFDPLREGEKLLKSYPADGMKIFLGLGGAYQIRPFLKKSRILVIEPDPSVLKGLLSLIDYTDLLETPGLHLLCRPSEAEVAQWVKEHYTPLLDGGLHVIPHRSCNQGFLSSYQDSIKQALEEISADCSTQKRLGRQWQRNILNSLDRALSHPLPFSWFGNYEDAVLTAAGPGLENHLSDLKNRSSSTLLLTVDTALPVLLKRGVIPDGVVIIDPQAVGYLHFMEKLPPSCRIIADWGAPVPLSAEGSRTWWISSSHPLCTYFKEKSRLPHIPLETGGNVTQAALSLLHRGGIEKVTLHGADFSYPEGKPYCRGSYFHSWHFARSSRLSPLEDRLTRFVLQRSVRERASSPVLYRSPLMKNYEEEFLAFIKLRGGRAEKLGGGDWAITLPAGRARNSGHSDSSPTRPLLEQYKRELEDLLAKDDFTPSPLLATLIPLGYAFLEDDGKKALLKAANHTLDLIKRRIS